MLSRSALPYEFRRGQLDMARAVERSLQEGKHLIVEAGTGTGKTLAYLLPALRTGQRVIISTGTKNLQEQLFFRDVPFLESLLGPLRVCYMKGRANYLCRHKLFALRDQPILNGLEEIDQFQQIAAWEKTTQTGDRVEIDALPEASQVWAKLDARSEACLGQSCPDYERCFITEMRRRALESDVIIVNHHLFFADLAIKQQARAAPDAGVLPEAAAVIFDEAHELEDVASSYFGISLSNVRVEELVRDMETVLRARQAHSTALKGCGDMLRERARMFFGALPRGNSFQAEGRMPFEQREQFLEEHGDVYLAVTNALHRLEGELDRLRGVVPIAACLDTCHTHVAGYDIVSEEGLYQTLQHLDRTVGLNYVKVIHCNDAKAARGSKLDRHQQIGKGMIGKEPFRLLLNDLRLAHAAFIAETPIERPGDDRRNVEALKKLVA